MKLNKKGFTLIELLAVILIITLVLGLSSYGIISAYKKSKEKALVLNEKSILEAARIYSTEATSDEWRELNDKQYFCTTIQRLKNAGLLKKEAKSEEHEDFSLITVERNIATLNVIDTNFVGDDNEELIELCDIKFFSIHYDYNVSGVTGSVPSDQRGEVCNSTICVGIHISSIEPKREGYRFVGWNTESDGSGFTYKAEDVFSSYSEEVITLYAQWTEDTYTVIYDANSDNVEGSTPDTVCTRGRNCTLSENGFSKNGYKFVGWNTKEDNTGTSYKNKEIVKNLTSSDRITLYAIWKASYKVIINFNVGENGVIQRSTTSTNGTKYLWSQDSNGIVSRSTDNGNSYSNSFFSISYNSEKDLPDYNNDKYINITNTNANYAVSSGSVWKCTSGECNGRTYNQTDEYNSDSFCNASSSNCTVTLTVNWENKNLLSPIITPSDGIASGNWHNSDYTLSVASENTGSVSYEYKVDNGNYQGYSSPISVTEDGIKTYTARTKKDNSYSGEVSYVSMLDKTPPTIPIIDNPTNEEWVNYNFSLTLHSTDTLSGIKEYQWSYDTASDEEKKWNVYNNSASNDYVTSEFKNERNQKVFVRACDYAGNCSASSSTYIRIDKTLPDLSFAMKKDGTIVDSTSNEYSFIGSSIPKWINYNPIMEWASSDSGSGIKEKTFSYNRAYQNTFTDIYGSIDVTSESEPYSYTVLSQGYRHLKFEACDLANNCTENNVYVRIDTDSPDFTFQLRKGSSTGEIVSLSSNEYDTSNSNNLKWINYLPYLEWSTTDSLSGININKKNNFSYNQIEQSTFTDLYKKSTIYGNNNNVFGISIEGEGYRYIELEICDNAGNCVYSDVYFKYDKTAPTINGFQMLNGSSPVSSSYYGNSASNSLNWFTFTPTLRWTATDTLSDVNTSGKYYYNISGSETISETLSSTGGNITGIRNGNNYNFNVGDIYGGYRKFKVHICDNAGNCADDTKYFRYHANDAVNRYVKTSTKCYSNTSTSSTSKANYNCGDYLSGLVKSYTGVWYYNSSLNCYVDGNYLTTSKPNCSSGSGEGSSYWVKLYKNCPASYSCHFKNITNPSDGVKVTYSGSMSVSNFPQINLATSNYILMGWKVGSATSTTVVRSYIDSAEHGKNLYAFWGLKGACMCSTVSDCPSVSSPHSVRCVNGLCVEYDSGGNAIGNLCW